MESDLIKKVKQRMMKYNKNQKEVEKQIKKNFDLAKRRGAKTPKEFANEITSFSAFASTGEWA